MQRETFEELCSAYVLGALSTEETLEFERELAIADSDSRRFFDGVAYAALHLSLGVELVAPPAHIKIKILQAILPEPEPEPTLWQRIVAGLGLDRPALAWTAAFLFLFGVLGSSVYSFSTSKQLAIKNGHNKNLLSQVQQQGNTITTLTQAKKQLVKRLQTTTTKLKQARMTIAKQADLIQVLRGKQVQLVAMGGGKKSKGYGKVLWDPVGHKAVLQVVNLPKPSARDYQLWWIVKERGKLKPIPAGVFDIAKADAKTFFNIPRKYLPKLRPRRRTSGIFGVTIEKKGGVLKPSMNPVILGKARVKINI